MPVGIGKYKHGLSKTNFYRRWAAMIARCSHQKHPLYKHYGGRGIYVCDRWKDFVLFREDMHESFLKHKESNKHTTIERINNDDGYTPSNCKWATFDEQANNRRDRISGKHKSCKTFVEAIYVNGYSKTAIRSSETNEILRII